MGNDLLPAKERLLLFQEEAAKTVEAKILREIEIWRKRQHFQVILTGVPGLIFIWFKKTPLKPYRIAKHIIRTFQSEDATVQTRFLYKMIPIHAVCRLSDFDGKIKEMVDNMLQDFPKGMMRSYWIYLQRKHSTKESTKKIRSRIASLLPMSFFPDRSKPYIAIMVYVIRAKIMIGMVDEYSTLCELNFNKLRKSSTGEKTRPVRRKKRKRIGFDYPDEPKTKKRKFVNELTLL